MPKSDDPITYAIIGAAYEVQRVLGAGFREIYYQDALALEFSERRIPFVREVPCTVRYKGRPLRGEHYIDFVCFDEVIVEVKARSSVGPADHAQLITCLASSKRQVGLLLTWAAQGTASGRRFIWSDGSRCTT
jgi:GxxExxY protein